MRRILALAAVAATAGLAVAVRPAAAQSVPNITAAKTAATNAASATNRHTAAVTSTESDKAAPAKPAAHPAKGQPAKGQPASAKPEAKPAAKPATTKADAKGTKAEAKPEPKAATSAAKPTAKPEAKPTAKPEAKPTAKPEAKPEAKADAKSARAADQSRTAAAVTPRDSAETIKVGASTNVAKRGSASELTFSREVYSYPGRGRRDPFMSLLKSGDLRPLFSDLKLVTVLYDPTGRNSVAIMRDLSTKDQYRVKVGQQLGRMRVAQIQPKQLVLTIEEFGFNRQEILALTSDSTRTR